MDDGVGIACGRCDLFNVREADACAQCGAVLALWDVVEPISGSQALGDTSDDAGDIDVGLATPLEIVPPELPPSAFGDRATASLEGPPVDPEAESGVILAPHATPPTSRSRRGTGEGKRASARRGVRAVPQPPVVPDLDASSGALPAAAARSVEPGVVIPDLDPASGLASPPPPRAEPGPAPRPATIPPQRSGARGGAVFSRPRDVVPPTAVPRGLAAPPPPIGFDVSTAGLPGMPPPIAAPAIGETAAILPPNKLVDAPSGSPAESAALSSPEEDLMDQARNFVCRSCQTPVPPGHKFCGRCGAAVPPEILNLRTKYFSDMQAPGKVKLILIKGEGDDGISYQLQATEHVAGRTQGQILFQHDNWLSPRHANFIYRGNKLVVRDEGSLNGVYLRVREGGQVLTGGDTFLCGEQLLRIDPSPRPNDGPDADSTYFYSSPKRPSPFRLTQLLRGGGIGMVHCPRENAATIGREGSDMNFPEDPYISASHAKVEADPSGRFNLVDLGSKNGTYVRVKQEAELLHGDYLFLGKQLLRVEIT